MIQRIQTIFLTLVIILGVVFSFFSILELEGVKGIYIMTAYKIVALNDTSSVLIPNLGVGVLQGIIVLLAIIIVFMFKNRQLQVKLSKLNILLIAIQIAAIVMYVDAAKPLIDTNVEAIKVNFKIGAIIPVLSLILTYLAIRFIKKDDKLVKAADRLR